MAPEVALRGHKSRILFASVSAPTVATNVATNDKLGGEETVAVSNNCLEARRVAKQLGNDEPQTVSSSQLFLSPPNWAQRHRKWSGPTGRRWRSGAKWGSFRFELRQVALVVTLFALCLGCQASQSRVVAEEDSLGQQRGRSGLVDNCEQKNNVKQENENENNDNKIKLHHHNVHKLMSEQDLRRTFQVASHDQVPEYELLQLTMRHDGSHLISPVSDLFALASSSSRNELSQRQANEQPSEAATKSEKQEEKSDNQKEQPISGQPDFQSSRFKRQVGNQVAPNEQQIAKAKSALSQPSGESHHRQTVTNENEKEKADPKASGSGSSLDEQLASDDKNRLIVINLSTFGRNFNLRLKRNADFQQRIKEMKMFLVESTGNGQLRYTVDHEKMVPINHKGGVVEGEKKEKLKGNYLIEEKARGLNESSGTKERERATLMDNNKLDSAWNLGTTYHDEENLAALLIEQDRQTGELKLDGTIGNDFVIKPVPKRALELLERQAKERRKLEAKLESGSSSSNQVSSPMQQNSTKTVSGGEQLVAGRVGDLERAAQHLHDDDPHDDDEMFLDEDEALEMAHNQSADSKRRPNSQATISRRTDSTLAGHTHQAGSEGASDKQQRQLGGRPRQRKQQQQLDTSSKASSSKSSGEHKWRKYRKLMAQTQVPKLHTLVSSQGEQQRPKRASGPSEEQAQPEGEKMATGMKISHHIVYRQRPSAEGSSSEHKHSFLNFAESMAQELGVPVGVLAGGGGAAAAQAGSGAPGRLGAGLSAASRRPLGSGPQRDEYQTDFDEDPLGGQFYLEPGLLPAGIAANKWSLISGAHALNATSGGQTHPNGTAANVHARTRRHALDEEAWADGERRASLSANARRKSRQARGSTGSATTASASRNRHKRQAPDTVWPEVLLVVDYDSFLLHGGDSRDVKRYFVSFWNGVDLRYKLLVHPHIRISLAGMIVAKDRDATPYLERNRLRAPNADAVDAAGALTDMGKYLYREDRLPTYDLAVVITKLDMCRRRYEGGRCNRGTAGFAYVGGACVVNKRLEKVNSVAIIEDSGGFSGIIVAAHEVGHL